MDKVARAFIRDHAFRVSKDTKDDEICELLCKHIDALVFNVTSLASIVVTLYQSKKLDLIHMPAIRKHIVDKCQSKKRTMEGGRVTMPSDFFGYNHPNYSPANVGEDVLAIDLNGTVARPALGPQSGGGVRHRQSDMMKPFIKDLMRKHNLVASRAAFSEILAIIDAHLECLAADLKKCEPLTVKKVESLFSKKRYFVFQ